MRRGSALLAALLLLAGVMGPAAADSLEDELNQVASRIDELNRQLAATEATRSRIVEQILATDASLKALRADLAQAEENLAAATTERAQREELLAEIRADLQRQYVKLAETRQVLTHSREEAVEWARRTYMNAGHGLTEVAFSVTELNAVALSVEYLARVAEKNETAVLRLEALRTQEERQRAVIEEQEARVASEVSALLEVEQAMAGFREQLATKTAEVEVELRKQQALLDELQHEVEHFEGEITALEKEQERIEQLIRERQSTGGRAPGQLVRPVPGAITSGFGPRHHPILGITRMHTGVDMSAGYGTAIKAGESGTVILAGYNGGYGNTVIIDHGGGMTTLYAHQSSVVVSVGEKVDAGEVIGYVGSTGLSTGPHLHFEVRINGKPVDPAPYL